VDLRDLREGGAFVIWLARIPSVNSYTARKHAVSVLWSLPAVGARAQLSSMTSWTESPSTVA